MNRLLHTIRHEVYSQYRNIVIASGAIAGSMLILSMVGWLGGVSVPVLWEGYQPVFIILGLLITTGAFSELRSTGSRIAYLLRPAATWEKVVAKLLVSTVFVWLTLTVAFFLASAIGVVMYFVVGGTMTFSSAFGNAFLGGRWLLIAGKTFLAYLPAQAIFFFGSVYFQKHTAGKTLLSVVAWIISYGVLAVITVRVVFHKYIVGEVPHSGARRFGHFEGPLSELDIDTRMWREIAPFYLDNPDVLRIIVSVVIVLLFWGLTVLRLSETEG